MMYRLPSPSSHGTVSAVCIACHPLSADQFESQPHIDDDVVRIASHYFPQIATDEIRIMATGADTDQVLKIAVASANQSVDVGDWLRTVGDSDQVAALAEAIGYLHLNLVPWSNDPCALAIAALWPLRPSAVAEVWEEPQTSEIWLDIQGRDNLAMAIGAGGANIRAANRLVNRRIMAVLSPEPAEGMDLRRKSQDLTGIVAAIVRNNVPEVATNKIEIVGVGYLPNEACKVGVRATGTHPNPVGACLGKNGDHLPAIRAALGGCPLSFFVWTDDPRQLVINALYPLEEDDIISFQENPDGSLSLVVSDDRVGAVVGKSGRQLRAAELVLNRTVYVQPPAQES